MRGHRDNYWIRKLNSSRLSRRRFVGGTAIVGAGAAGLALVGCGDDDDDDTGGDDDDTQPTATTADGGSSEDPTPTEAASGGPQQGGVRRASSADNTFDTFDADRSRFTPFAAILGWTNLGIVAYKSFANAELAGHFAESWETPDDTTIVFHRRKGVTWHNKPPVDGRETTADDMAFFINRNKGGALLDGTPDPNFYRTQNYATVETVEVTDNDTLTVKFSRPNPFFLATLAGSYAKVQAPEAVEAFEATYQELSADKIIGTGAFILTEFAAEGTATFVRNEEFFDTVWMDGLEFFPLFVDNAAQQAAFEGKEIDVYGPRSVDVRDDLLETYDGQIYNTRSFAANPMGGTYYGGAPPWSNQNLIGAIQRTIDRRLLIQQLFQGDGVLSGNIPPPQEAFGIPESELVTFGGYLEDHDEDLAEAKKMWEAGDGASLGTIIVDVPDIWEGAYSGVSASVLNMLNTTLGNQFQAEIHPYSTITNKLINQSYGNGNNNVWWGWISDIQSLEPTESLWNSYNSASPQNFQFGVLIPEVDELTNQAIVEPDVEVRKDLDRQIVRLLLENWGAGIPYLMLSISNALRWNYLKTGESPAFVNAHNDYWEDWFDMTDPTFEGRPA